MTTLLTIMVIIMIILLGAVIGFWWQMTLNEEVEVDALFIIQIAMTICYIALVVVIMIALF